METINETTRDTESLFVTDRGDFEVVSSGLRLDNTPRTKCLLALKARRGEYWFDPDYGSRLREIKTLRDARRLAPIYVEEALAFMIDRGEILGVETVEVEGDPEYGAVKIHVLIKVTEDDIVDILIQRETP